MRWIIMPASVAAATVLFVASIWSDNYAGEPEMTCSAYDTALMKRALSQTLGLGEAVAIVDPRCMTGIDGYRAFRIEGNDQLEERGLSFSDADEISEAPLSMLAALMPEMFPNTGFEGFKGYEIASRYEEESNIGVHVLRRKGEAGSYIVLVADLL